MYHWYALDIEQSLDNLREEISEEQIESLTNEFINGYRSEYDISDEMLKLLPIFRRYIDLYGYVKILRSSKEKWDNEPDWLVSLRIKLKNALNNKKANFATPI
jgi:Ser/Thr protein kinase RdoA (MazF antagonist)